MDKSDKQKQAERTLRGFAKVKTREERKALEQLSKQRKQQQKQRNRQRRDWSEYDEDEPFEDFERIVETPARGPQSNASGTRANLPHDWQVVAVHTNRIEIAKNGKTRDAILGGVLLQNGPPVTGDRVSIQELAHGQCRILSIDERDSWLGRSDPGNKHKQKFLAANVDLALIALPAQESGHLRVGIIERIRIALEAGEIRPVVVATKVDRLEKAAREVLRAELNLWNEKGVEAFATSSLSGEGLAELQSCVAGMVTVVVGHSGVGKSTLLNALDPENDRDTGGVREADDRGRHTTTSSRMTPLVGGGWLIDTPGIRQFGLSGIDHTQLLDSFPRLVELAWDCPRGCKHDQEDCALERAAERDHLVAQDLHSYRRILEDI